MARVPVSEDLLVDEGEAKQFEKLAKVYIAPMYKHFVWKILRRGIRQGRVLDIGCGAGLLALGLSGARNTAFEVVGVDLSPSMLGIALANARRAKGESKVSFVQANATRLPFPDASFDLVISHYSLHMWVEPVTVLDEIYRVVKGGGMFLLRDGRRLQGFLPRLFVSVASSVMSSQERQSWRRAILSGYTPAELEELLRLSRLQGWRVKTDEVFFDLCLEAVKAE